jgi:2-polyprenyl-3-methyl-5-hydroxy-6-metoxy-1,4-benzoquinol methylase
MSVKRNLIEREVEDFKPPVFKPNTTALNRLGNWARRFVDLQTGSIWRDLHGLLAQTHGSLLDIGCGAQIYRNLLPADVAYYGLDTIDTKERFGYEIPDTHYFQGDNWGIDEGSFDTALCTEVLEHISDPASARAADYHCAFLGALAFHSLRLLALHPIRSGFAAQGRWI